MQPDQPLSCAIALYLDSSGRVTSDLTAAHYKRLARSFAAHLGRIALLSDLTDERVGRWLAQRRKTVAPNTVRGEAAKMLAVWRWLARKGWAVAPDLQVPRRGDKSPRALTLPELRRLFRAGRHSRDTIGGVPGGLYWPAMLGVLFDTAERIGAVITLEWADLDTTARTVYFAAEHRKGGISDARKSYTRQTAHALRRLKAASPATPFGAIKLGAIYYHWALLRESAGLPRDVTPHTIRRTHATYLHLAGGDARASLGHSSDAVTVRHYLDPTITDPQAPCDRLPRVGGWWRWLFD